MYAVLGSQRAGVQMMLDLAARGHPRYCRLVTDGGLQRELRAMRWGEGRRERFLTSVRRLQSASSGQTLLSTARQVATTPVADGRR